MSQSPTNRIQTNPSLASPGGDALGSPIKGDVAAIAAVVVLLKTGSPGAIFGRVTHIIVAALQCVRGRWFWSHIRQESGKVVPASADGYAPAPIVFPRLISRVAATFHHSFPGSIFRRLFSRSRLAVLGRAFGQSLAAAFQALLREARGQVALLDRRLGAAFTAAQPHSLARAIRPDRRGNDRPLTKGFIEKILHILTISRTVSVGRRVKP